MILQKCQQIVRSLHRTCPQLSRRKLVPGVGHHLKAFDNDTEILEDPEAFGDLESDFTGVGKTHRQHEAELMRQREKVRQIMVRNKYFPEQKLPNLLFYAEKEEMRCLYARNPEEWTIERLAESFPATPQIVKKIVHSNWRPYTEKRIRAHDEAVIRNWERFKHDKEHSEIPTELQEHLSKFAARTLKQTATAEYTDALLPAKQLPPPSRNEFSSIITTCKKYAYKSEKADKAHRVKAKTSETTRPQGEEDTYLLEEIVDKRHMRYEDMRKLKLVDDSVKATTPEEQVTLSTTPENPSGTGFITKFESTEIVINAEDSKRFEMLPYKDRIHIPRKLWRKGKTYRVDDAYYDDDGEFLYRVPGMSSVMSKPMAKHPKK